MVTYKGLYEEANLYTHKLAFFGHFTFHHIDVSRYILLNVEVYRREES